MLTIDHMRRQMERQFDFIMAFWNCPKPTTELVHGFCMAGAFEVALACNTTVAAGSSAFFTKRATNRAYEIMGCAMRCAPLWTSTSSSMPRRAPRRPHPQTGTAH